MQTLRYWEYYGMTKTFSDLYQKSKEGKKFRHLYDLVVSKRNIMLAYRHIKNNPGADTPGTDGKVIHDISQYGDDELVDMVNHILTNYQPKTVRRVLIPKPNGKTRPLGIPCIMDRLIQQCFKQVLEPIAEAKFYKYSYGFRPLRSTKHAIARVNNLVDIGKLHYVVDVDIKGFFDNVNHNRLKKQLWNMGIQDRRVLSIINKMLKAEIEGEGHPTKGTPQGGILSPLLSNIVLHDLDMWVANQWDLFPTVKKYATQSVKTRILKETNLKEGYIVRYADDFKILCRNKNTAEKWFKAVKDFLKIRLKLDISEEKSQIVNLRTKKSEFLGFTLWASKKGNRRICRSGINTKQVNKIKDTYKKKVKEVVENPTPHTINKLNGYILGVHNYYQTATQVYNEFNRLAYDLSRFTYNRLKTRGKYGYPTDPNKTYTRYYSIKRKTFRIDGVHLFPINDVKHKNPVQFNELNCIYTELGRERITKSIRTDVLKEIAKLLTAFPEKGTIEFLDGKISRFSMKKGLCEISGSQLTAETTHCHHYKPKQLGGNDEFTNLRIIHKDIHKIIHATRKDTLTKLIAENNLDSTSIKKINLYRKKCNLEPILME